ncbi:transporter substrate-binding domain-containing protein [Pseudoalteromonas sp. SR44-8]|nr:transporter substrate-binding domain-containing protein [Pseudoalteromonas sp. SR44-8]MBB1411271.1 transporter substrate-binding domain-containing protein [Pseudoalteromonas sp. SG44-17]
MKKYLVFLLLFSGFAKATMTPVSYQVGDQTIVAPAVRYEYGYAYNIEAKKLLKLVTLNWPPYIDESLCNNGWLFQLTVKLLLQKGYGVHIEFLPWARALRAAELGHADILFPEYFIDNNVMSENKPNKTRNDLMALSSAIPGGNLSLVALNGSHSNYDGSVESIKDQIIGVVRAYKNTPELDKLIDSKQINTIVANNEFQQIHLLMGLRVDLIVADFDVLIASIEKSAASEKEKQQMKTALMVLSPPLGYKPLYYTVSKANPYWQEILADLNNEIKKMKEQGALSSYIEEKKQCSS